jgi:hypothetical protein
MSLETGSIEFEAAALEHPLLHALIAMQQNKLSCQIVSEVTDIPHL